MMVGPIQRRDCCYMPDPHLAPLAIKAQVMLALWYLCLMQVTNFCGIYTHWCSASVPAVLKQDKELRAQDTEQ